MKILVTGGAGFIGAHFVLYWLREHPEDTVVNLDALTYAARLENLASVAQLPNYHFIQGDISDPETVQAAMEGVDIVVHCAAETHVDRSIRGSAAFVQTNVVGTHVLLEAARAAHVRRFHHISTDEVFGSLELDTPDKFSETTRYDPHSPYSASKAASDHLVRAYYHTYGLPITISNCSNNYGPFQFPEKFIPVLILKALRDEPLPLYGDGLNVRDWIQVEDHVWGIDAILERGTVGETYCLGGNAERSNRSVAEEVLQILGKPSSLISLVADRPGHDRRYAINSEKAERELGWQRRYDFSTGLRATVAWYQEHADQLTITEQGVHVPSGN